MYEENDKNISLIWQVMSFQKVTESIIENNA